MFFPPFAGSLLKIARARRHYAELAATIEAYQSRVQASYLPVESELNAWTFTISESPPPEIAVILGDMAHRLRSALDVMLCDLARLRGKGLSDISFPFASSEEAWKQKVAASNRDEPWKKVGDDVVAVIDALRPYRGGNLYLRALHDLNNLDKHKLVYPVASIMSTPHNSSWQIEQVLRDGVARGDYPPEAAQVKILTVGGNPTALIPGTVHRIVPGQPYPWEEFPITSAKTLVQFPDDLPDSFAFRRYDVLVHARNLLSATEEVFELFSRQFGSGYSDPHFAPIS